MSVTRDSVERSFVGCLDFCMSPKRAQIPGCAHSPLAIKHEVEATLAQPTEGILRTCGGGVSSRSGGGLGPQEQDLQPASSLAIDSASPCFMSAGSPSC